MVVFDFCVFVCRFLDWEPRVLVLSYFPVAQKRSKKHILMFCWGFVLFRMLFIFGPQVWSFEQN